MSEQSNQDTQTSSSGVDHSTCADLPDPKSSQGPSQASGSEERKAPAFKLSWSQHIIGWIPWSVLLLALLYLVNQFCSVHVNPWLPEWASWEPVLRPCVWMSYVSLGLVLSAILVIRYFCHREVLQEYRGEDLAEVEATMVEARNVQPRLSDPERPESFKEKRTCLLQEVARLKEIGVSEWVEYQVLPLNQLLVEFLKDDELVARAKSSLEDLSEYAEDSRHDRDHYQQWKTRIDKAIEEIRSARKNGQDAAERDTVAEKLRGELRTLLEHVADYDKYWAEGSAILKSLMTCGVFAIPVPLTMGILPFLHPNGNNNLGMLNWGLLGISGALSAVLLNLHNSNLVEAGFTKGKTMLWRAVLGTALGLVAGVLLYSMIRGGIVAGQAFPSAEVLGDPAPKLEDVGLSIFWGIFSGFSFDWVFNRLRREPDRDSS